MRSTRDDVRGTWAIAQESNARLARAERERTGIGFDPTCRYARVYLAHECQRNTGEPIRPGESCFLEARTQLAERVSSSDVSIGGDSAGFPAEAAPSSLPQYRLIDLRDAS
jgi:hypothetical protein